MKKLFYGLWFFLGLTIGLGSWPIYSYLIMKAGTQSAIESMALMNYYTKSLESEDRELNYLIEAEAPVEAVENQFDRISRLMEFFKNQKFMLEDVLPDDKVILQARWSRFLEQAGRQEKANQHLALMIKYGTNSSMKITDKTKAKEFIKAWESTMAHHLLKHGEKEQNPLCKKTLTPEDLMVAPV